MRLFVKIFTAKSGKKTAALVANFGVGDHYLSFDTPIILEALDLKPSELRVLEVGEYDL